MKIVFATNNQHKLDEIRSILGDKFEIVSLADIGCHEDIPETGATLEENALMKAQYVYDHYHVSCFADDTGLEVEALNGAPGVYSARYASMSSDANTTPASHDSEANMARLLRELENNNNRGEGRALDTIPSSNLKAIQRPLQNWVLTSKTKSVIVQEPPRSWQNT